MRNFIVLLTDSGDSWSRLSPDEQRETLGLYGAWVTALRRKKAFVGGEAVGGGGRVLRMSGRRILERPFKESKNVLTGYFVLKAKNLAAATRLARGCPALGHGETVIVRPVG